MLLLFIYIYYLLATLLMVPIEMFIDIPHGSKWTFLVILNTHGNSIVIYF
jgi:hypothetical protein